jgi:D-3-phosphoglycerate dehydrogenase
LPECVGYLAGIEPIGERVLKAAKNLKVISRNGVGIDNIDLKAAKQLGIAIRVADAANSQGVAELAMAFIFLTTRSICSSNTHMKEGQWRREKGIELEGKVLGIIGCGNIGKKVARMATGIGMGVLGYDLYPDISFSPNQRFKFVKLDELFRHVDIITLHCPPCEIPIINKDSIMKMKEGIILINTARASLVDESALLEALNSRKIAKYATDVYNNEPPKLNELITHEMTICTPHIGGYTKESIDRAAEMAVDNLLKELS